MKRQYELEQEMDHFRDQTLLCIIVFLNYILRQRPFVYDLWVREYKPYIFITTLVPSTKS